MSVIPAVVTVLAHALFPPTQEGQEPDQDILRAMPVLETRFADGILEVRYRPARASEMLAVLMAEDLQQSAVGQRIETLAGSDAGRWPAAIEKEEAEWTLRAGPNGWRRLTVTTYADDGFTEPALQKTSRLFYQGNLIQDLKDLGEGARRMHKSIDTAAALMRQAEQAAEQEKPRIYSDLANLQQSLHEDEVLSRSMPATLSVLDRLLSYTMIQLRGNEGHGTPPPVPGSDEPPAQPPPDRSGPDMEKEVENLRSLAWREEALAHLLGVLDARRRSEGIEKSAVPSLSRTVKSLRSAWSSADTARELQKTAFGGDAPLLSQVFSDLEEVLASTGSEAGPKKLEELDEVLLVLESRARGFEVKAEP